VEEIKKIKMAEVDVKYALNDTISISIMKRLWLNPHPKHLSKSPALSGFFVCSIEDGIGVFGAVGIDRHYMPIVH
jgi:hypothetical protein